MPARHRMPDTRCSLSGFKFSLRSHTFPSLQVECAAESLLVKTIMTDQSRSATDTVDGGRPMPDTW
jgi:hypothetical protein